MNCETSDAQSNKNSKTENNKDSLMFAKIYEQALVRGKCYENLDYLANKIGARLSGSPQNAAAVEWAKQIMDTLGFDRVELQPVMVPHWVRGKKEVAKIISSKSGATEVPILALGGSAATPFGGLVANVVEVKSLEELKNLGKEKVQGKIVFFNKAMNPMFLDTFDAYSDVVGLRAGGASEAAKLGAVGVVIRSLASNLDNFPHTGGVRYEVNVPQIPAVAISTNGAELLSKLISQQTDLQFFMKISCKFIGEKLSYNVIGEIKGSEKPNEYILVGGHLDSWDVGQGAHDDGAGVVQSMEVARIFKTLNYKPKKTLRVVLFANEENGLKGGKEYARVAAEKKENHIVALESDAGGFLPIGFSVGAKGEAFKKYKAWEELFQKFNVFKITEGGGGADISPLKPLGTVDAVILPDSQRYFNYHHTVEDTFDKVDKRELELGAAAMASFMYMLSEMK